MNKMWKRLLAVSLAVLLLLSAPMGANIFAGFALTASAASYSGTCGENLTWTLDTDTGILAISGTGAMEDYGDYSNPPWYNTCSSIREVQIADGVTSIGDGAFCWCESLTSITIPDSVTSIGDYAFYWCTSLTSVTIPDSVTSIGDHAFSYCMSLTSVTIPDSVTSIGDYAFSCVGTLFYAGSASGSPWDAKSVNGYVAGNLVYSDESKTKLVHCSVDATGEIILPNSVTSIGNLAFHYCTNLTSVNIPDSVTSIGGAAFYYCTSLTSLNIPDSVTSIGEYAFSYCMSLTSVTIGNNVTSIGEETFGWCVSLSSVTIPKSITEIATRAFLVESGFSSEKLEELREAYNEALLSGETEIDGMSLQAVKTILDHPQGSLSDVYYLGTREEWNAEGDKVNERVVV